ncbi:hypothetical protein MNBD_BACTEROID07-1132 [hydrothermal vent metagenome]|uniref:Alginate export domain-containing protein n=1 Tax=hydrothermal vent metagenome TaxID=652676 RepID=A0A3B0UJ66_9ZZZZ
MKKLFHLFIMAWMVFFFAGESLYAQSVTLSGEIRPRYEFRHGYKTIFPDNHKAANFISQRTRLNFLYGNKYFKFGLVLQDIRVWGDVPQLNTTDVNGLSVHEAWGEVIFNQKLSLKLGRQEISYDDQRIFGNVGWTQQARSHDAAIIRYRPDKTTKIDVGIAYNADKASLYKTDYTVNNYRALQYIWYHGQFKKVGLSLLLLNNGMPYSGTVKQKVVYSQTLGGRVTYNNKALKFNSAFYYQGGKNKSNRSLSAMYFTVNTSYTLPTKFTFGLGGEYLSGTSSENRALNNTDNSFKPLYGTNHKFNGWMDYFYAGSYMNSNGLIDINMPLSQKINQFTFKLIPHYFIAAAKVAVKQSDGTWKAYKSDMGMEIDFAANYALSKNMTITAGYSQMLTTETLQVLKGGNYKNSNNWAWLMVTFKPTFFSKK